MKFLSGSSIVLAERKDVDFAWKMLPQVKARLVLMNRFSHAPILCCRGRREFCSVATSIMRSGNDFPERMKHFAHVAPRAARGEVDACRVLLTLGRGPMSFADAVLRL